MSQVVPQSRALCLTEVVERKPGTGDTEVAQYFPEPCGRRAARNELRGAALGLGAGTLPLPQGFHSSGVCTHLSAPGGH